MIVTTWSLEMRSPDEWRRAGAPREGLRVEQARVPSPELNRYLYRAVGGHWYWRDRMAWSYEHWQQWLQRPEVTTWVLHDRGTPAGYVELEQQAQGRQVEISYFGLLRPFIGQGLGGYLLSEGIRAAWARASERVWVHTCSLDGPAALSCYQSRGFRLFRSDEQDIALPGPPDGPWRGAYSDETFTRSP